MEKVYKNCQSCGMPLSKDTGGGGTHADGSHSTMYCSYCYGEGRFKQPDFTAEQMQEFVKNKMKEMKFPGFLAWLFSRNVPSLERWRKK